NKKNSMVEKQYAILIQAKAKDGDKVAQKALADLYRDGRGVVKKDVVALMWYIISDKNGDKEANRDLSFTKSYMATDQIDQAQKLASKWLTLNQ
ncbi:MAG: hypothetical protein P8I94_12035, partial [Emcibacteraceae bacterium]|nr:hypothetical protein [Emcibacteraceae bacterium]